MKNPLKMLFATVDYTKKAWRGSSGETVAQRKSRQENAQPEVLAQQFRLRARSTPTAAPERERRSSNAGGLILESAHLRRRRAWESKLAHGHIDFRPLGSRLSMRVRRNLRWGHTWVARKVAAAIAAKQAA